MEKNKQDYDIARILKNELNKRNNPTDLKSIHIGTVVNVEPVEVSIYEGKVILKENDDLYISEWFRFRCDIDKEKALSEDVPNNIDGSNADCESAKAIHEVHSYGGAPCIMPNAISYLASAISKSNTAITKVNEELLNLKCELEKGDYVLIGSLEQLDRFILIDKLLNEEE